MACRAASRAAPPPSPRRPAGGRPGGGARARAAGARGPRGQRLQRLGHPPVQQRAPRRAHPGDHRLAHERVGEAVAPRPSGLVDQPRADRDVEALGGRLVVHLGGGGHVPEREVLARDRRDPHRLADRLAEASQAAVDDLPDAVRHLAPRRLDQRRRGPAGVRLHEVAYELLDEERVASGAPVHGRRQRRRRPARQPRRRQLADLVLVPGPRGRRARDGARAAGRRGAHRARAPPRRPRRAASRRRAAGPTRRSGRRARASAASPGPPSAGPPRPAAPAGRERRGRPQPRPPRTGGGERRPARPRRRGPGVELRQQARELGDDPLGKSPRIVGEIWRAGLR